MVPKQDIIQDILDSEQELVQKAPEKYGDFFAFTMGTYALLQDFLTSVDATRFIFTLFLSQVRKHLLLAILSTVRLHTIQAHMNVRQVLESGVNAAYAIANPEISDFGEVNNNKVMNTPQRLTKKRYKWLENNFLESSRSIKGTKELLNDSSLHSNIVNGVLNFEPKLEENVFNTPFFDIEDEYHVKVDLWMIGDITWGLMDLFYGVNQNIGIIKFSSDFLDCMKKLREQGNCLKQEIKKSERFQKAIKFRTNPNE